MALQIYRPADVLVIIGAKIVQGIAEDSGVSWARNVDAFTLTPSIGGGQTRVQNANKSGRITVNLNQSSLSNDDFMAFARADELGGKGVVSAYIEDKSGRTLVQGLEGWVVKLPDGELSNSLATRAWVFEFDVLDIALGGN